MENKQALRIIRETKTIYNTIAKDWDASRFRPSPLKIALLKSVKRGGRTLDLGCGNGFMAKTVLARGGRYFGLDTSSKLIALAKKRNKSLIKNKSAKFVVGDALRLPYKDNFFDFIFSFAVLHHIPSEEKRLKFFSEMRRVLKPAGSAVLINWNLLNDWSRKKFKIAEQLKNPEAGFDPGDARVPWKGTKGKSFRRFLHIFSAGELKRLAKTAGFKSCLVEYRLRGGQNKKNAEEQVVKLKK